MISVITPVYNGILHIESCIVNVLEQACADAEHIIVDGGSTDGTVEVIKRYAEHYRHIRWLSEKDRGQSDAMNKGIQMAKGDILGFLNVDDFYEPGCLNEVLNLFKTLPEPSLLVGNCNMWGIQGELIETNKPAHLDLLQLLSAQVSVFPFPVNPSAYFYSRSLHDIIGMYDIHEHYTLDLDFILRAVMHVKPVYVNESFGNYRYLEGTKTFEDMKKGSGDVRFGQLIKNYRRKLPPALRLKVFYFIILGKFFKLIRYNP
ncbi:MAG TPA: glycosyltransferase family 2 protein [Smithellaceae bacterium]|nr:glycosyltransferase family 2 protein [Smithellaceae bacterium]HPL65685.1 glycosyltransferase family 2 protein [Smithellaceae bacterium]